MTSDSEITPFLVKKWRHAFLFFDHDKDGEITAKDFTAMADYISKATQATDEESAKTRQEWLKWFEIVLPLSPARFTWQSFRDGAIELFKDVETQKELNRQMASDLFDRMDFNKDGKISSDELSILYGAVGVTDKALAETVLKHLDKNGDGYIQREELVEDFVRHFTDPDPTTGKSYLISSLIDEREEDSYPASI